MNDQVSQGLTLEIGESMRIFGFLKGEAGGTVQATAANGTSRELEPGDPLLEGDSLASLNGGQFLVVMQDGTIRELPRDGSLLVTREAMASLSVIEQDSPGFEQMLANLSHQDGLTELLAYVANGGSVADFLQQNQTLLAQMPANAEALQAQGGLAESSPDFEQLLAAVTAGEDISTRLAPTAAGETGTATGGDSVQSGATFERVNQEVNPETGIDPTLTFAAGLSTTANSTVAESQPLITVQVEPLGSGAGSSGELTPDSPVSVGAHGVNILEATNDSGEQKITLTLTLSEASSQDIAITYQLVPQSAANPQDWYDGPLINTVIIPAGETTFTITVTIIADHLDEGDETFEFVIIEASNADVAPEAQTTLITIVDDDSTPVARDDLNSVQEDLATGTSGNVITATAPGDNADTDDDGDTLVVTAVNGAADSVGIGIPGSFGVLTLGSDGNYTYQLDNESVAVQGLGPNENLYESFSYTISDGYNAPQTATLVINISGSDDGVSVVGLGGDGAQHSVAEDDLVNGSDNDKEPVTVGGSFTVEAVDGLDVLKIGSTTLSASQLASLSSSPVSISSAVGILTLTGYSGDAFGGSISYTYELKTPADHSASAGGTSQFDQFTVTLLDQDGSVGTSGLVIEILDDSVIANVDVANTTEGGAVVNGNVVSNDLLGADGFGSISWAGEAGGTVVGSYGTLSVEADGKWTYTPNGSVTAGLQDTFSYTVVDADGDSASSTLTLTFSGDNNLPTALAASGSIDEDDLPGGTDPGADSSQVSGSVGFGYGSDGAGSIVLNNGTGSYGTMVMDGLGNWTYTLSGAVTHAAGDGENTLTDSFTYTVTDSDGSTVQKTIDISIIDDVPAVTADAANTTEGGSVVNGNVVSNDLLGADGFGSISWAGEAGGTVVGSYGTLSVEADGNWSYTPNGSVAAGLQDTFSYTVVDADGDSASSTLTLAFSGDNNLPTALAASGSIDEDDLPGGTDPGADSSQASGSVSFGYGGDGAGSIVLDNGTGSYGTMVMDGLGNWTYTLSGAVTHAAGDGENTLTDSFTYTVTDSDGSTVQKTIDISIIDDVPVFNGAQNAFTTNQPTIVNGVFDFDFGADGAHSSDAYSISYTGPDLTTLSGKSVLFTEIADNVLLAYVEDGGQVPVFALTLNQDSRSYSFQQFGNETLAATVPVVAGQGSSFGGGPDVAYIVPDLVDPTADLVLLSGYIDNANVWDPTANFFTLEGSLADAPVNLSQNAYGISNPLINPNEVMILDFTEDSFGLTAPGAFSGPPVNEVTILAGKTGSSLTWVAYDTNGDVLNSATVAATVKDAPIIIDGDGQLISFVAIYGEASANTGIVVSSVSTLSNTGQLDLTFAVSGTDGDGDSSTMGAINIQVDGSGILVGTTDSDALAGGPGSQTMTGDLGADIFQWHAGDEGTVLAPATDTITDFSIAQGDVLELSDLLGNVAESGNDLDNYLHFGLAGDNTVISISTEGNFAGGYDPNVVDQEIVVNGNLLSLGANDAAIIDSLLLTNNLNTDSGL